MRRFYFNFCGALNVADSLGIRFDTDLQAFRAAKRLAEEVAEARPSLRDKAWIAMTREGSEESYCVAIDGKTPAIGSVDVGLDCQKAMTG